MTWQQLDVLYEKGWDVFNHSYTHKSRSTHTMVYQDYVNEISLNKVDVRNKTKNKIEMPLFVVPSGDVTYQDIAYSLGQQLVFDQSANTIGVGGLSVTNDFSPNGKVLHRQLMEDALGSGGDKIGTVATKAAAGNKLWYNEFTHGINSATGFAFPNFLAHLERIANTWGKTGTDRVWMASLQEVYEYLSVRQKITYTATISGNQLILDFNLTQLPTWLRRKPLTLVVNSGGSFSNVTVPQGMKMTFNGTGTKKLINLDFAGVSAVVNPCDTDTTPPTFTNCPTNINLTTTNTTAQATWTPPTAADNCTTPPSVSSTFNAGASFPIGTTPVIYTATDSKGNKATCSFNIIVSKINVCDTDTEPPTITNCPQNIALTTTVDSTIATWTAPTITDNCSAPRVSVNFNSGQKFPIGVSTVVYTVKDLKNNTATCNFTISVTKITSSETYCVSKSGTPWSEWIAEVQLGSFTNASGKVRNDAPYIIGYSDFKDKTIALKQGQRYPLSITPGISWEGYKANLFSTVWIDFNGNKIFEDTEKVFNETNGVAAVSDSILIPLTAKLGATFMRVSLKKDGEATSCETFTFGEVEDYSINIEKNTVNPCDNDVTVPIITYCQQDTVVDATSASPTSVQVNFPPITATDNCSTPSVYGSRQPNDYFPVGSTFVGYTAEDAKGNKSYCNFTITVNPFIAKTDIALGIWATSTTYRAYTLDTFYITAKNTGTQAVSNIKIEFKYPFKTANGGKVTPSIGAWKAFCTGNIPCFQWEIPSLAPNQIATLEVPLFMMDGIEPIVATTNLLASTPTDTDISNNQATVVVQLAPVVRRVILSESLEKATVFVPIVIRQILPNPTDGDVSVAFESISNQSVQFNFYNTLGQIVKTETRQVEKGDNQLQFDMNKQKKRYLFH